LDLAFFLRAIDAISKSTDVPATTKRNPLITLVTFASANDGALHLLQ
jgi:hypothetical protein